MARVFLVRIPRLPALLCSALLASVSGAFGPCSAAAADAPSRPAGQPALAPLTSIEAGAYGRADLVVEALLLAWHGDERVPQGPGLARARIERVLKDERVPTRIDGRAGDAVAVSVAGTNSSLDPRRALRPLLGTSDVDRLHVFFLRRAEGSQVWRLDVAFSAEGVEGQEKVAALLEVRRLRGLQHGERVPATLEWLLGTQRAVGIWTRENGARELAFLAKRHPAAFDPSVRKRLRAALAGRATSGQRQWLEQAAAELGLATWSGVGESEPATPVARLAWSDRLLNTDDARAQAALLIARLDQHPQPGPERVAAWAELRSVLPLTAVEAQTAFLRHVGDVGVEADVSVVRSLYAGAGDLSVREATVRAVGLLGGARDVEWLRERLAAPGLWHAAGMALARVRTARALQILAAARRKRVAAGGPTAEVEWLDHLLDPAFTGGT